MKNNFLTIVRARHKADADTEALTTRLKRYAEITLVHLFKHEPVFLLFVATASIHQFPAFQQRLTAEDGIFGMPVPAFVQFHANPFGT